MNRAFALFLSTTVGLALSACTEGDDLFVNLAVPARAGTFSGTSVDDNNRAPDGLAFSPDGVSVDELRVAESAPPSDSPGGGAPTSSSTLYLVRSGGRLFASHRGAGAATPLVELRAPDQDSGVDLDLSSSVLIPLALANYDGLPASQGAVRANDGAWLVLWTYQSFTAARRRLAASVFLPSARGQEQSVEPRLGSLRFGFQELAQGVELPLSGAGEDLTAFAVLSDGLVGSARFTSTARAHEGPTTAPVNGAPAGNSFRFGHGVTRLGLLAFQIDLDDAPGADDDSRMLLAFSSFDLANLRFETAQEQAVAAAHKNPDNTGLFEGASAFDPAEILVSNQHALLLLEDTVRDPGTRQVQARDRVLTTLSLINSQDGTSQLATGLDTDLSLNGANLGFHALGSGEEAQLSADTVMLGPDEGLGDETVVFYLVRDNTTGGGDLDTDLQLHAAALESAAGASDEGRLKSLPARLSSHRDLAGQAVSDPVSSLELRLTTDGLAALVLFRQREASVQGEGLALNAVAFDLDDSGGFTSARFSAETRVDGAGLDPSRAVIDAQGASSCVPLNAIRVQDDAGPACAGSSGSNLISLLYEQSDDTQDRVFMRPVRLDLSAGLTIEVAAEVELEAQQPVTTDPNPTTGFSAFSFLEGSVDLSEYRLLESDRASGGQSSEQLVVFSKESDDSSADGDARGDRDIVLQRVSLDPTSADATLRNRVELDDRDEGDGQASLERTSLVAARLSPAPSPGSSAAASRLRILFRQPIGDNITSPLGLFTRSLDLDTLRAAPTTPFASLFEPPLNLAGTRLDRGLGSVAPLRLAGTDDRHPQRASRRGATAVLEDGPRLLVFYLQGGHVFASETRDGVSFAGPDGTSQIVDHEGFGTPISAPSQVFITGRDQGACGHLVGASVLYLKEDAGQERRALLRVVTP